MFGDRAPAGRRDAPPDGRAAAATATRSSATRARSRATCSTTRSRSRRRASCTASSSATTASSTWRRPRRCGGAQFGDAADESRAARVGAQLSASASCLRHPARTRPNETCPFLAARVTHLPPLCDRAYSRNRHVSATELHQFVHRRKRLRPRPRRGSSDDVGSALLALGGRRPRLDPARARAGVAGGARARAGAHRAGRAGRQPRAPPRASRRAAGRGDRARRRRRDADGALRRHRRARRTGAGRRGDRGRRRRARPHAARGASACRSSTSAPRRAARARRGPGRCACRSRSAASPSNPATSSAPTPTASRSSPAADADAVLAAARALEEREREIVAALERGETTVDDLRAEGAAVKIAAHRGDSARDPAGAGVPLGGRRAARREPRPLLRPHRRRRRRLRRVDLRGPARGRRARRADGAAAHRPLARRHGGDPALDLERGPLEDVAAVHADRLRGDRGRLLGRARPRARRADAHVLRRRRPGRARLLRLPPGRRPRHARRARAAARGRGLPRDLPQGRPRRARRRRLRRGRTRGDRARPAAADRPERGVGSSPPRSSASAGSSSTTSTGSSSPCPRRTSPASRTCAARSNVEDRRRPGRVHDWPAPRGAREARRPT